MINLKISHFVSLCLCQDWLLLSQEHWHWLLLSQEHWSTGVRVDFVSLTGVLLTLGLRPSVLCLHNSFAVLHTVCVLVYWGISSPSFWGISSLIPRASLVHWLQALWLSQTRCSLHCLCFGVLGDQACDPLGSPVLLVPLLLPEIDLWCQGTVPERNKFGYFVSTGNLVT